MLHCNHLGNSLGFLFAQGSLWCTECYDGRWPFPLKYFGLGFTRSWGLCGCASIVMDRLSDLRCFQATVHTQALWTELCLQEKQISQTYLVTAFFRGRRKKSYLLVSLLWKKLLHKFCTYYSPGVKDVTNVPIAEKLFLFVLFSYWTPENLALTSRYSRTHPLVICTSDLEETQQYSSPHTCSSVHVCRQTTVCHACCMGQTS